MPWIEKARNNNTKNLKLLHELRKVKMLFSKESKYALINEEDKDEET